MAEAGVPMAQIAQYLGHSDSSITERVYARYSPDFLRGAAAALEVETAEVVQLNRSAKRSGGVSD